MFEHKKVFKVCLLLQLPVNKQTTITEGKALKSILIESVHCRRGEIRSLSAFSFKLVKI